ncbi:MAG: SIGNAL peptide protein [Flavobacteriales bacterium]|nr:SIGNAL peptide protein [Flavobacteriales bacterium]|tara:strand:+ start:347 stop:781 length:435 start_codon:yes stop_codon:yes gene_type:complete
MLLRLLLLFPIVLLSQDKESICGIWLEEEKQSHIEIYKTDSGDYEGKIIWLAEPLDENGNTKLDKENPDKNLRNQTIKGLVVINDLKFIENNKWSDGTIYDARSGKTYSLNAHLKDPNTLFMRGYIGFSLIGRTTTWTRLPEKK